MYSLACCLLELLTKKRPWANITDESVIKDQKLNGLVKDEALFSNFHEILSKVPAVSLESKEKFIQALEKCLSKEPENRPSIDDLNLPSSEK